MPEPLTSAICRKGAKKMQGLGLACLLTRLYLTVDNPVHMTYDDILSVYKTQQRAAEALGISQPTISGWRKNGVPELRQFQIQAITRGRLKAAAKAAA